MVAGGVGAGDSYGGYRAQLVETLQRKGIRDLAVLRAVGVVPRHLFVPESVRHRAYDDAALPIGNRQTISQPWVQARYLELLRLTGRERALEIGTGSGYQTALLALPAPLVEQLGPAGRMVIPLGDRTNQTLTLVQREQDDIRTSTIADVRFVPLLGEFGFR
jgi:protein-L-isoaspartate O-methyltransferase